jgi:hypothetical protein
VTVLVDQLGVGGEIGLHLGLQRHRQHPAGTFAEQLLQISRRSSQLLGILGGLDHGLRPLDPVVASDVWMARWAWSWWGASRISVNAVSTPTLHGSGQAAVHVRQEP